MTRLLATTLLLLALTLPARASGHRLSVHLRSGVLLHLAPSQTAGGAGFSLGLQDTLDDRFVLGGDLGHLFLIGNAVSVRLFAGVQRKGAWAPAAFATAAGLFGHRLAFLKSTHPNGPVLPPLSLGMVLAPLRFRGKNTTIPVLELGAGVGPDLPGLGLAYQVTLVDVGADF